MIIFYFLFISLFISIDSYSFTNIKRLFHIRDIDKKIFNISKPATLNYIMIPIVGMVDTFWVSKLGNSNQLAGAGSGDQIFSIFYVLTSFLPAIITPKISELKTLNKNNDIKEIITISLLITNLLGIFTTISMNLFSDNFLKIFIGSESSIYKYANEYFKYRTFGMCSSLTNSLIFSILRGLLDFNEAIKINLQSQLINVLLDPIFMNFFGLKGVAIASVLSDIYCSILYINLLIKNNHLTLKLKNFFTKSYNLLKEGIFIQLKNTMNNFMYLYINKKIINLDNSGVLLASNIFLIKFLELSLITFSGLYSSANIIIPKEKIQNNDIETKNRLIFWSIILGLFQSFFLFNSIHILPFLTSDINVINTCKDLIIYIIFYQIVFGHSYILEGILQGYQKFKNSGLSNMISFFPMIIIIYYSNNLKNIWLGSILTLLLKCIYIHNIL